MNRLEIILGLFHLKNVRGEGQQNIWEKIDASSPGGGGGGFLWPFSRGKKLIATLQGNFFTEAVVCKKFLYIFSSAPPRIING